MCVVGRERAPDVVISQLIDLHVQGRFSFDRVVRFYEFDQINPDAADAASRTPLRLILRIDERVRVFGARGSRGAADVYRIDTSVPEA